MPEVTFNGNTLDTNSGTVASLLVARGVETRGVAVAVNGTVVPKSQWLDTRLKDGDVVEVVTAAAGG